MVIKKGLDSRADPGKYPPISSREICRACGHVKPGIVAVFKIDTPSQVRVQSFYLLWSMDCPSTATASKIDLCATVWHSKLAVCVYLFLRRAWF